MSEEQTKKLLKRLRDTQDGMDFIEYLKTLSCDNYRRFKRDPSDQNDIHKGYALCVDSLIEAFQTCGENETVDPMAIHGTNWT